MGPFNTKMILFATLEIAAPLLLLCCCVSYADDSNGARGSVCSPTAAADSAWTENLTGLFASLTTNVNPNNGYYKTEVGQTSDKIYGLIQCRGDMSPSNCRDCTLESFRKASEDCNGSKSVIIWQKWCFLRYSNASFYGVWERTRVSMSVELSLDDPNAAAQGMAMMAGLVDEAPEEKAMFATSEVDVGNGGRRFGMAQCTGDLGKTECGDCLDCLLNSSRTIYENRREWEAYGVGCSLWYDDSRFYFNYRASPANANSAWAGKFGIVMAILMVGIACF